MHTLYDVEAQVPAFVHITEAKVHDSKAMPVIPYESGAHYIFDRGYLRSQRQIQCSVQARNMETKSPKGCGSCLCRSLLCL